ncbi:cytochrome P450 6j1-like [Periplaneta americana]|uniref:cytochrome P450 6j1-like n=1 Tax=Periplaneta americana TaxID=6978 RepID=UPI0037E85EA6
MTSSSASQGFYVVAALVTVIAAIYFYVTRKFNFWKNHRVAYVKPVPFFGSLKDLVLQKVSIGTYLKQVYDDHKGEPYVGIFSFDKPAVVVCDLDLIKNVLVKDASNFSDRVAAMDEGLDPLGARNLFVVNGDRWKHMRTHLSPTFTSGKMKTMFHLVDACAKELVCCLDEATVNGDRVEVKDAMARYTTDVIASCAFGIDSNSLKNPNSEFRTQLRKVFEMSTVKSFALMLSFFVPGLLTSFRLSIIHDSVNKFTRETVWSTVDYREKNGITRRDFLDIMIELRRKGKQANGKQKPVYQMDGDDFVAQALSFMTAGFETSSSTISFTLYELSLQPELQQRLRDDIVDVLNKHDHQLTYEAIQDMKYLDMVVSETLRKYPILPFLDRRSFSKYQLPCTKSVTIPEGTSVYIPVLGLHYDPQYFPEPDRFDPERFSEENKVNRPAYCYLPFGEGPRFCIGMRFGLMQTKTGLIHILSRYEVAPCKDTPVPLVLDRKSFLVSTKEGIPLSLKKIKT